MLNLEISESLASTFADAWAAAASVADVAFWIVDDHSDSGSKNSSSIFVEDNPTCSPASGEGRNVHISNNVRSSHSGSKVKIVLVNVLVLGEVVGIVAFNPCHQVSDFLPLITERTDRVPVFSVFTPELDYLWNRPGICISAGRGIDVSDLRSFNTRDSKSFKVNLAGEVNVNEFSVGVSVIGISTIR